MVGGSVVGGWQHLGLKTNFEKRNHRGSSMRSRATRCRLLIHSFASAGLVVRKSFFSVLQHLEQQNNLAFCPKCCSKLKQEHKIGLQKSNTYCKIFLVKGAF